MCVYLQLEIVSKTTSEIVPRYFGVLKTNLFNDKAMSNMYVRFRTKFSMFLLSFWINILFRSLLALCKIDIVSKRCLKKLKKNTAKL